MSLWTWVIDNFFQIWWVITQKDENVKNNCYVKVRLTFTTAMAILGSMKRMPLFIQDTDQTCRSADHNVRPEFFIWRPYCPLPTCILKTTQLKTLWKYRTLQLRSWAHSDLGIYGLMNFLFGGAIVFFLGHLVFFQQCES